MVLRRWAAIREVGRSEEESNESTDICTSDVAFSVKRAGGLIEQHDEWLARQTARDAYALPLFTGQLA